MPPSALKVSSSTPAISQELTAEEVSLPTLSASKEDHPRRVSFSPSVEEAEDIKEELGEQGNSGRRTLTKKERSALAKIQLMRAKKDSKTKAKKQAKKEAKPLLQGSNEASLTNGFVWQKDGIHGGKHHKSAKTKVTKQQAVASRHAKLLEQLMNGTSASVISASQSRENTAAKPSSPSEDAKAQAAKAKQLRKLKAALLDVNLANSIIGKLRVMQVDPTGVAVREHGAERMLYATQIGNVGTVQSGTAVKEFSPAEKALQATLLNNLASRTSTTRMICLDCDELTAETRHAEALSAISPAAVQIQSDAVSAAPTEQQVVAAFSVASGAAYLASWLPRWSSPQPQPSATSANISSTPASSAPVPAGRFAMPRSMSLPQLPEVPTLMGVSPIALVLSPTSTVVTAGADKLGAFNAMASFSGAVIQASGTNVGLAAPTDRMSIFVHWWGFEIALPEASLAYLGTAHNISGGFLNFLSTMAISGGVPELLPFIRYISMFVDTEFKAIQAQDKGKGVAIAAVWAFPMALVPRPCECRLNNPWPKAKSHSVDALFPSSQGTLSRCQSQHRRQRPHLCLLRLQHPHQRQLPHPRNIPQPSKQSLPHLCLQHPQRRWQHDALISTSTLHSIASFSLYFLVLKDAPHSRGASIRNQF